MKQQTVVVTGGAGYVGSHTAWLLARKGYRVIIVDKLVHGQSFSYPWALCIEGDCGDTAFMKSLFTEYNVDAVMHFAAYIEVGESVRRPADFYENNVVTTFALLNTMRACNITTFVFSSSCAVYGTPQKLPLCEDHPRNPLSPYGNSKLMVELMLHDMQRAYNLNFVALRYFNVAGAVPEHYLGERHVPETHVIPLLIRAAVDEKPFSVFGTDYDTHDGTCVRDYLHVRDIAQAHYLALDHVQRQQPSDVFNLGTGNGFSVLEMIRATEKIVNKKITVHYKKRREGDPSTLVADPSKAHSVLRWQPEYSQLDVMLKTAYLFEQEERMREVRQNNLGQVKDVRA